MGEAKRRALHAAADIYAKAAADKGLLIEAGWLGLKAVWLHPETPPSQEAELRQAFFAGAQHLYGSIMGMLDPGEEPTDADLTRMENIDRELEAFIRDFELRHVPTQGTA
jgi:hypothetical protein